MDKDVVVSSLKDVQGGDGDDYLRKIIQIPITIPKTSNSQLNFVLHKEFEKVLSVDKYTLIKELYNEIINVCVIPFISTIRDVKRIINLFEFKNSFLKDEVNQADLLALCVLELYVPEAYDIIRSNKENLTKFHFDKILALEQKIQNLNINHDRNAVSSAIAELFSKAAKSSVTDKFRRLSDSNYFDVFFSLSLPSSVIPFEVIDNIIKIYSKSEIEEIVTNNEFLGINLIKDIHSNLIYCTQNRFKVIFEAIKPHYTQLLIERGVPKCELKYLMTELLDHMDFDDILCCYQNADFGNKDAQEIIWFTDFLIYQEHRYQKMLHLNSDSYDKTLEPEQLNIIEDICKSKMKQLQLFSFKEQEEFYNLFCLWKELDLETCKSYINKNYYMEDNALQFVLAMVKNSVTRNSSNDFSINTDKLNQLIGVQELHNNIINLYRKEKYKSKLYQLDIVVFLVFYDDYIINGENVNTSISYDSVKEKMQEFK